MILGIGTDIIEIKRIQRAIEKYQQKFLSRIFTQAEQKYCLEHQNPYYRFAGRFAAKEAVVKALGTGFGALSWCDIEICNNEVGKPYLKFSATFSRLLEDAQISISISHCREYATAVAIYSAISKIE
jgi:holo-[acyl-carrier protein] synthase